MHVTERLKGESSKEYAMRVIRENIISLELEPGTSISANELASEIPVSRGPIREALSELSKIGIVEVYPQSGCKISMIDYTVVEEARFLRNTLECAIVKEACQVAEAVNILRLQENVNLQKFYMENHKTEELLTRATNGDAPVYHHAGGSDSEGSSSDEGESFGRQIYKHLMNGVSHMLSLIHI